MNVVHPGRDLRIDFWRGLALLMIFVNHVPGNVFEHLTSRNFGFSDAAELFVFLAGFAAATAYLRRFADGERLFASAKAVMRGLTLYVAHLATMAVGMAVFAAAALVLGNSGVLVDNGVGLVLSEPVPALVGIATLSHQIDYFNILPMYVAFLLALPAVLWLACRDLRLALFASGGLWFVVQLTGLNAPAWPGEGGWYFNPLAWQFLFVVGLASGALARRSEGGIAYDPIVFRLALAFVLVAFVWRIVQRDMAVLEASALSAGFDKTDLGVFLILHMLALVYVVACGPWDAWLRRTLTAANPIVRIGRHALIVFCLGSLMAALGRIVAGLEHGYVWVGLIVIPVGLFVHVAVAHGLEWMRLRSARVPERRPAEAAAGPVPAG